MTEFQDPTGARPAAVDRDIDDDRSIGAMIGKVAEDFSILMQQELELAKAELKQTATRAGTGAGMFGGAGVGALLTLIFLSTAAWWAIGNATGRGWSALIVAAIWAIITAVLFFMGRAEMAKVKGLPKTTETVQKIPDALKGNEGVRHEHP
jgi:hypothetical protein